MGWGRDQSEMLDWKTGVLGKAAEPGFRKAPLAIETDPGEAVSSGGII
ncbi:MAG: hypothetical protein QOD75_2989 [Blastocatellia bacterium]|jgi:hypothetical protein|nr:hypothetical protein [Blastocatellia bacterium]